MSLPNAAQPPTPGDTLTTTILRYHTSLIAQNKRPRTITGYMDTLRRFQSYLLLETDDVLVRHITTDHAEGYIAYLQTRISPRSKRPLRPASRSAHYRALNTFFNWCVRRKLIEVSPMDVMQPPRVPDDPPQVVDASTLKRLLKTTAGNDFYSRRDRAIIRILFDNGMRREELATLTVERVDLGRGRLYIEGKGGIFRYAPIGKKATHALKRYLELRAKYPGNRQAQLWIGANGPMTGNGIYQVVRKRARQAEVENVYPHKLRHTFAHNWLMNEGTEGDAMLIAGWRSRKMLDRYGKSAASIRAHAAHKRIAPGDRI